MYILIYLRILKLYYHILDKGDGRSGKESLLLKLRKEEFLMAAKQDYYKVLGIDKNADDKTIKKAYRKLAKKYHPDMNPGNAAAEQKFKEVTEAYNVLSDAEKKKLYDQFGHAAFEEGFSPGGGQSYNADGMHREYHFTGDASDIFGDIFGDLFNDGHFGGSGSFGGHGSFRESGDFGGYDGFSGAHFYSTGGQESGFGYDMRGDDAEADIEVTFDEAVFGCDKVITLHNGSTGNEQSLKVHIPAGIDDGNSIRLKGKGHPGIGKAEDGDLFLRVKVGKKAGCLARGVADDVLRNERRFEVDRHLQRDDCADEDRNDRRQPDRVQAERIHFVNDPATVDRKLLRTREDLSHQDEILPDEGEEFRQHSNLSRRPDCIRPPQVYFFGFCSSTSSNSTYSPTESLIRFSGVSEVL